MPGNEKEGFMCEPGVRDFFSDLWVKWEEEKWR